MLGTHAARLKEHTNKQKQNKTKNKQSHIREVDHQTEIWDNLCHYLTYDPTQFPLSPIGKLGLFKDVLNIHLNTEVIFPGYP